MPRRAAVCAAVLLSIFVAGCAPHSTGTIVGLPWHQLDLPGQQGGQVALRAGRPDPDWLVAETRPWRYIVIHHSGSERGSAASIDAAHRERGWDGLGYHFVIDSGSGGPDGLVETGYRWRVQKWGAHTGGTPNNAYNKFGIGICLVGNFTSHSASPQQLASLERLVVYLAVRYNIAPQDIIGHRDAPNAHTECPGQMLHAYIYNTLRPGLVRQIARR
jgi:hypothetical protein